MHTFDLSDSHRGRTLTRRFCVVAALLLILNAGAGCEGSKQDKSSPSERESGKKSIDEPMVKGKVGVKPQVLYDLNSDKSFPLSWSPFGERIEFTADSFEYERGGPTTVAVSITRGTSMRKQVLECSDFKKGRGDRVELMIRYDSAPDVKEVLHILCITGGKPGSTHLVKRYLKQGPNDSGLGYIGEYGGTTAEGIVYEPNPGKPDALYLKSLVAGEEHSCGIRPDGTVVCWGDDVVGETKAPDGTFASVAVNVLRSCGIRTDKTLACWGDKSRSVSQFGGEIPKGSYVDIAVGHSSTCTIDTEGKTQCWAIPKDPSKKKDKTARTTVDKVLDMTLVEASIDVPEGEFVSVEADYNIICGLLKNGTIVCWGSDAEGLVSKVPAGKFTQIALETNSACALAMDGTVSCWGSLVDSGYKPPSGKFSHIDVAGGHACAVGEDQSIKCWGYDDSKQLDAPAGSFVSLATGDRFSCAIKKDQTVVCWGQTGRGVDNPKETALPYF